MHCECVEITGAERHSELKMPGPRRGAPSNRGLNKTKRAGRGRGRAASLSCGDTRMKKNTHQEEEIQNIYQEEKLYNVQLEAGNNTRSIKKPPQPLHTCSVVTFLDDQR